MSDLPWKPSATLETLKRRAAIIAAIRQFFADRNVWEVETPVLARYTVTDPHMPVITADNPLGKNDRYFLQTSPEYAMKRLLAVGSGPIYQIARTFRKGERGSRHNPEFTLLEWYRPGFALSDLMDEVEALVRGVLQTATAAERISYRQLFLDYLEIDPFAADLRSIETLARARIDIQMESHSRDDWLNVLMAEAIEPRLARRGAVFVYNYPVSQAALARQGLDEDGMAVARRFELYVNGVELANGYDELADAGEQRRRFETDRQQRSAAGKVPHEIDEFLIAALAAGLPPCSGVALGLDRLVMLALGRDALADVLAFSVDRI